MNQNKTVLDFVEQQRIQGVSDKEVLHKLLEAGWPADIAIRAIEHKSTGSSLSKQKRPSKP